MRRTAIFALAWALAGCTTSFYGAAKVPNGPTGCKAVCAGWEMELAGMVKMGEYSDGCICQVKPAAPAPGQAPPKEASAAGPPSAAVIPAAAGVFMQMEAERRRQASAGQPGPGSRPGVR